MLQINRIMIKIKTNEQIYGFDEYLKNGMNFIVSDDNTCGKSSILSAIYYCLGFEEIIGGIGEKVLTAAYKTSIEDNKNNYHVLESGAYLEIFNGKKIITIFRSIRNENRDHKLITVYNSSISEISTITTLREDMYVHMKYSATNEMGFHSFLEKFLNLDLPMVPSVDGNDRKLYLQLIFSAIFIEQKHGWNDILSGIPVLGIKEAKKRVLEFVLNLDIFENQRQKIKLKNIEQSIKYKWKSLTQNLFESAREQSCSIIGLCTDPYIMDEKFDNDNEIKILKNSNENISIDKYIQNLREKYKELQVKKPKIKENYDQLQNELEETEYAIKNMEKNLDVYKEKVLTENEAVDKLSKNLETIEFDLQNNKDAARLKNLGSELNLNSVQGYCPMCGQKNSDTLLPNLNESNFMSIDDNIIHLNSQRDMILFALEATKARQQSLKSAIFDLSNRIFSLRSLAKSIRNDLYSVDNDHSEAIVYKRIEVDGRINDLLSLKKKVNAAISTYKELSIEWKNYLNEKKKLPKNFTELDLNKLDLLQKFFINNLKNFNYKSSIEYDKVAISTDTYLPIIEGFDMKFDSSASDNIRAIWAFTIALYQTSLHKNGNHPRILIYDEPGQHSIVLDDIKAFLESLCLIDNQGQIIVAITAKDSETKLALKNDSWNIIHIKDKAFKQMIN